VIKDTAHAPRGSRFFGVLTSMTFLGLVLCGLPRDLRAQPAASTATAKGAKASPPLTPDGQPDIQGLWDFGTITPLERPAELAGKEFFTEQEAADWARKKKEENSWSRRSSDPYLDLARGQDDYWADRGELVKTRRTSLIIDPPDGRIPALTEDGMKVRNARLARYANSASSNKNRKLDGPEDLTLAERCLSLGGGPPITPTVYNNNVRIEQGGGYVMIMTEMIHDARIVPLDGRPHLPEQIRLWKGDSRGHWEGDTLVVETTNFADETSYRFSDRKLRLIERFKRLDKDTLQYRFTIDDPSVYVKPWTAEIPANRTEGPLLEYACHEGNVAMKNMLAGARKEEKKAAEGSNK
jgi:hypothetical protein